jgi:glycosyltransferase involved in cell wall biosynthesis
MNTIESFPKTENKVPLASENGGGEGQPTKPLVSLVVPAFNEAAIIKKNLTTLCQYMESLEGEYRWEMIVVDDGSTDATGELAEMFAGTRDHIHVLHHGRNFGLGQAFQSAFIHCRGDYIVTLDLDLSYSPDHIRKLLTKIRETRAKIVVASPYTSGGKISNVPWLRRTLSVWANRFLSITAKDNLSTLTGMVRAYDGKFLRSLNLKSMGMEINPEILYKAMLLRAQVEEVPAYLDWHLQRAEGVKRRSSMKVLRHTMSVLVSGFLFRPVMFFLIPSFTLFLFALYVFTWMLIHFFTLYPSFPQFRWFPERASAALAATYEQFPHTFIIGGLASMLAIQLFSLGILALQSKSYFEEIFHLGTTIYRLNREERTTHE